MRDQHRKWKKKFADAFRGVADGVSEQNSFVLHIPCGLIVIVLAVFFRLKQSIDTAQMCVLLLAVGAVIAAELFNSSIEWISRAIIKNYDEDVRKSLDIASGAVLAISFFSMVVGLIILLPPLIALVHEWIS